MDKKQMRLVYMEVTKDKYELPLAVSDSIRELARMRGVNASTISHAINGIDGKNFVRSKYKAVEIDEDEDDE